MGRVYHPKERLKYLPEDVSAALAHVRRGMSIRKTARRFKNPCIFFVYKGVHNFFAVWIFMSKRLGLS